MTKHRIFCDNSDLLEGMYQIWSRRKEIGQWVRKERSLWTLYSFCPLPTELWFPYDVAQCICEFVKLLCLLHYYINCNRSGTLDYQVRPQHTWVLNKYYSNGWRYPTNSPKKGEIEISFLQTRKARLSHLCQIKDLPTGSPKVLIKISNPKSYIVTSSLKSYENTSYIK